MAAAQYSDYYYNNNFSTYHHYQHHQSTSESQQQNFYGQYDCKNLNNYNYNYNDQWSSYYQQPQYHHQQLSMLNNQINDDYKNYTHQHYNNGNNVENQPNLNCNQYENVYCVYGVQNQNCVTAETRKRKIESETADDSPALRALLSKPSKRAKYVKSPYFYHPTGNVSPASSTSEHFQTSAANVSVEQSINLVNYNNPPTATVATSAAGVRLKEGYESSSDEIKAVNAVSPMSSSFATPPSSPKDTSSKHDDSAHSGAAIWSEQNEGENEILGLVRNFNF